MTDFDPTRECQASISGACYWMFQGFRECDEMCAEHPEFKPKIIGAIWGNRKEDGGSTDG